MWVGVFDRDGMAIFVAFADPVTCLGYFQTPEAAWDAVEAYLKRKLQADEKSALKPTVLLRETKWGRNGFGHWVFSDVVDGITILKGSYQDGQTFYLVIDDDGNFIGEFATLKQALAVAREASNKRARKM